MPKQQHSQHSFLSFRNPVFTGWMLAVLLFSCKKDIPPDSTPPPAPVTTATLRFEVKFAPDSAMEGVLVGIAGNETDRDAGLFIRSGLSNPTGLVILDALQPIPWYYQVTWNENGIFHHRKDSVHTEAGKTRTVKVFF